MTSPVFVFYVCRGNIIHKVEKLEITSESKERKVDDSNKKNTSTVRVYGSYTFE